MARSRRPATSPRTGAARAYVEERRGRVVRPPGSHAGTRSGHRSSNLPGRCTGDLTHGVEGEGMSGGDGHPGCDGDGHAKSSAGATAAAAQTHLVRGGGVDDVNVGRAHGRAPPAGCRMALSRRAASGRSALAASAGSRTLHRPPTTSGRTAGPDARELATRGARRPSLAWTCSTTSPPRPVAVTASCSRLASESGRLEWRSDAPAPDELGASVTRSRGLPLRPSDAGAGNEPVGALGVRPERAGAAYGRRRSHPWKAAASRFAALRLVRCCSDSSTATLAP